MVTDHLREHTEVDPCTDIPASGAAKKTSTSLRPTKTLMDRVQEWKLFDRTAELLDGSVDRCGTNQ